MLIGDNTIANMCGNLTIALIGRRLCTTLWYCRCLPVAFCALLCDKTRDRTLVWLRASYEAWAKIDKRVALKWAKLKARSPYKLLFVQQALA